MDQRYLQDLYGFITAKDPTYSDTYSYEQFVQKMQDRGYSERMFNWLDANGVDVNLDFYDKIKTGGPSPETPKTQEEPLKKKAGEPGTMVLSSGTSLSGLPSGDQTGSETISSINEKRFDISKPLFDVINGDLITQTEEYVVPKLQYQFGSMGFTFEESGLGDNIKVTAPNGKTKNFSLDPWFGIGAEQDAENLKSWIKQNLSSVPQGKIDELIYQEQAGLKKYNNDKQVADDMSNFGLEADQFRAELGRIANEKSLIESSEERLNNMTVEQKATPAYAQALEKVRLRKEKFLKDQEELQKKYSNISEKEILLKQNVGKYTEMKSQQGQWRGGLVNALADGFSSMASWWGSTATDLFTELLPASSFFGGKTLQRDQYEKAFAIAEKYGIKRPEAKKNKAGETYYHIGEWQQSLPQEVVDLIEKEFDLGSPSESQLRAINTANKFGYEGPTKGQDFMNWYDNLPSDVSQKIIDDEQDLSKKAVKKNTIEEIRNSHRKLWGDDATTAEWSRLKEQDFWGGAFLGLAKSLPAMLGSTTTAGWAMRTAQMYAQTSDGVMQEIDNDPELSKLSENEKLSIVAPIGVAGAVLETYGLRNVVGGKGLLNGLVARALGKAGVNTTAKTFGRFIREDVDNMIARGLLTVGAAGLAEFETGAAQQFAELGIKEVYNQIKDKKDKNGEYMKMFNTPESIIDWSIEVLRSGAQEAVGGFLLGVPSAVSTAYTKKGFKGMNDDAFLAFEAMANDENMQSAYITDLKNKVNKGELTMAQAKESLNNYRNSVGLFRSLPEGLDLESKKEAMNLLREKKEIEQTIQGKEKELTKPQQTRINEINQQLTKLSEDAVQKSKTDESVLRTGEAGMGLQGVGEGNGFRQVEAATIENEKSKITESPEQTRIALQEMTPQQKRSVPIFDKNGNRVQIENFEEQASNLYHSIKSVPVEQRTGQQNDFFDAIENLLNESASERAIQSQIQLETPVVNVAPFFDTQVASVQQARELRESTEYKGFLQTLGDLAKSMGIQIEIADKIGGYKNDEGNDITELSALVSLPGATIEQAEQFAAISGAVTPNVQESTIAGQFTELNSDKHNANEYELTVSNPDEAVKALKESGISNFTIDDNTGVITFVDVKEFSDPNLKNKVLKLLDLLKQKGVQYDEQSFKYRPVESRFVSKDRRRQVLRDLKSKGTNDGQIGQQLRDAVDRAIQQDSIFRGETREEYEGSTKPSGGPVAGNRLFNKPLKAVAEIADRYFQRAFGKQRPRFYGTRGLDKARAKRIADAYDNLINDPNNPEVRAAYEALAKETIEQYKAFLDAGYVVEVNNDEPYANSQEMIEDLRNNKRIKIFSTESGFGDTPITDQQRAENPLLGKSEFTDRNGVPMLINDLFRAVHDFYGHAELGNSFGEKGEENAWNVHVRMFSPLAARAMTTETRGQNSYVNSSGINEKVEPLRKKARDLRKEGKFQEARQVSNEIYEIMKFADQKVGLLPEEFSRYEETETGDAGMREASISEEARKAETVSSKTQQGTLDEVANLDTKDETNLQKVYNFLDNIDQSLDKFGRETAGINLALPVMKAIVKSLKALVQGGMVLSDAIKKVASDFKVSELDVMDAMLKMTSIEQDEKPEGYDRMMQEVDGIVERMNQRGEYDPKEILNSVLGYVQGSKAYQDATPIQQENLVREMRKRFGKREKQAPAADRITGQQRKKITVDELSALKQQIRLEIKAAKDGVKSVTDAQKAILKYFNEIKDRGNLTRKDIKNVLNIISGVKDQKTLDKAADKIFNIVENATTDIIEVSESKALREGLKRQARAAREAKADLNTKRKMLGDAIRKMASTGKLTTKQAAALVRKVNYLNLDNDLMVSRFLTYADKVFSDAEYASKLQEATSLRKAISKLSKNKEKNAQLRNFGNEFKQIDPSMIEDIDTYIEVASKLKESLRGSQVVGQVINFADIVNIENATEYLNETLAEQKENMRKELAEEISNLLGIDVSDFSYDDMLVFLNDKEKTTKYNETQVRDAIRKAFSLYSSIINNMLETGKDAFSDPNDENSPSINLTGTQRRVIRQFMSMDTDRMSQKEALAAIDALVNFIQNNSIAKMEDTYFRYTGALNAAIIKAKNIVAKPLRKYWSKGIGGLLSEYTTNLGPLFERMFKGVLRGGEVEDESGLTKVKNGKSLAEKMSAIITNDYINQFYKRKANGQKFNTAYNNAERGMIAFLIRNVIGTPEQRQKELFRRRDLIRESIDILRKGNEIEQKKAEIYQEVYDKIFNFKTQDGAVAEVQYLFLRYDDNLEDTILTAVDQDGRWNQVDVSWVNIEAVQFWMEKWADIRDELSDVSESIYNKILEKDDYFTPDRYHKLESNIDEIKLANDESAFHTNNGTIYKKEAGSLMAATRPSSLPKGRYIDLSFDNNNANAMYDALVDVKTAGGIRQVEAFLNAPEFKEIVPFVADEKLLRNRIQLYINRVRNKSPYSNDNLAKAARRLNRLAALGVSQALAGVTQPLKQTVPAIFNTLINAGRLDLGAVFNPAKMKLINESGYSIANRGFSSQAQIESINRLTEEAERSKLSKAVDNIAKINELYLKILLAAPDVAIARAAWLSYYEQSLKKQGIDISGIDWDTHELNETAANYAQRMLDRQQNISDPDQAGKLFADSGNSMQSIITKIFMPFASFRLNQSTRLANDLSTLGHWGTSTKEDKLIAIRSLSGYVAETVIFRGMSAAITIGLGSLANAALGNDEDEEEYQKRVDSVWKGQGTSFITELLSPVPFADKGLQLGIYNTADFVQSMMNVPKEERVNIFEAKADDFVKSLGAFGIGVDRAYQFLETIYLSSGGSFTDKFGKEKYLDQKAQKAIGQLAPVAFLTMFGLVPSEVNSVVRNAVKIAKREDSSTIEGGKSEEQERLEGIKEGFSEENKIEKEERKQEKVDAINSLLNQSLDQNVRRELSSMLEEENMTASEKRMKNLEKVEEKIKEKELLGEYRTRSEMKRYNPDLYERLFGEGSEYRRQNYHKNLAEELLDDYIQTKRDRKFGYSGSDGNRFKGGRFSKNRFSGSRFSSRWSRSSKTYK